jgi:hypothetical protein
MARPERHDVDYFPFFAKRGKTLNVLQSKYGLEGIGFFTNLMRFLALTPDHYCCIKEEYDRLNFFAEIGIQDEEKGTAMIELMVKTGKLDQALWEGHKVVACEAFLESLEEAYKRRSNEIITIDEIRAIFENEEKTPADENVDINPAGNDSGGVIVSDSDKNGYNNPQSKVKKSKVKKSKVNIGDSDESQKDKKLPFREREPQNDFEDPPPENGGSSPETFSSHFIRRWQQNADVFNFLARLKRPSDWQAFWEQNTMTLEQIDLAIDNFIAGVKSGAIERRFVPSSPDAFVINGWLQRSAEPFKKQGQGHRISNDIVADEDIDKYFREA